MERFVKVDLLEEGTALTIEGDIDFNDGLMALINAIAGIVRSVVDELIMSYVAQDGGAWTNISDEKKETHVDELSMFIMNEMFKSTGDLGKRLAWLHDSFHNNNTDAINEIIDAMQDDNESVVEEDG
jgi:hypothetical protein